MGESDKTLAWAEQVISAKSKWQAEEVIQFLSESRTPLRLASMDDQGYPQITSLWYLIRNGCLLCCTQPQSVIARQLLSNPRVGLEVAVNDPPYRGVSGQGDARVVQGDAQALLSELAERYLPGRDPDLKKWLLSRAETEVILEVTPRHLTSWDFRARMTAEPT